MSAVAHDPGFLPPDLPVPVDDGACDHLLGTCLPSLELAATDGRRINLSELGKRWSVLYVYPRTGVPGVPMPEGWDDIPGARGCTPQSCSYRDDHRAFRDLGVNVYGLSTQSTAEQREFADREHIPFPLLSDRRRQLMDALVLPTFEADGETLYRRVTLIIDGDEIVHVRYPVFPPDSDAAQTVGWLRSAVSDLRSVSTSWATGSTRPSFLWGVSDASSPSC